jgi:hypothetical protein
LLGDQGQQPRATNALQLVNEGLTNALWLSATNSRLVYRGCDTNGVLNFHGRRGTVIFWICPDWASASLGGTGPEADARIFELGRSNSTIGWWSIRLATNGNMLMLDTMSEGGYDKRCLSNSIAWPSNAWQQVAVMYSASPYPTFSCIFTNGTLAVSNFGGPYYPTPSGRTNLYIGNSYHMTNRIKAVLDEIQTFNYPLAAQELAGLDTDGDGMPDAWELAYGINALTNNASLDADLDGVSNLQEYLLGTDPQRHSTNSAVPNLVIHTPLQ